MKVLASRNASALANPAEAAALEGLVPGPSVPVLPHPMLHTPLACCPAPPTCYHPAGDEDGQHSPRGGGGAGQFPRGDWEQQQRGEPERDSGRMGGLAAGMDIDVPPPHGRERGPRGPLDGPGPPFDRRGPPPGRYDRDFDRGPPEFDRRGPPPPGRGGRFDRDRDLDREGGPPGGPYGRGPPPGPGRFDERGPPRPFRGPPDRFDERGPPPGPPFRGPPPPFRDFPPPGRERSPPGGRCAVLCGGGAVPVCRAFCQGCCCRAAVKSAGCLTGRGLFA